MGFFSGGSSTQTSDSYSGLRNTKQFGRVMGDTGYGYDFGINKIRDRINDNNPLGLMANGLTGAQNNAFATLGKQMFGDVSGSYAGRGFLSPDNVSGVIGSSLQQAAPQLMGQVFQNQMGNQSIMSDRFGALNNLLSTGSGLLGSENHSFMRQQGPNMLGSAVAGAIGKWASPDWMVDLITGGGKPSGGAI